jgi:glutathione S-transferase
MITTDRPVIMGALLSPYARAVCCAFAEKGAAYELDTSTGLEQPQTPEYRALHPFGKIPVMRHRNFVLYESGAICRYLGAAFDGPALQPAGLRERAVMDQWMSALQHYFMADIGGRYIGLYLFLKGLDGAPDRAVIDAARGDVRHHVGAADAALEGHDWIAGDALSLVDLYLHAVLGLAKLMPDAEEFVGSFANIERTHAAVTARASFQATLPSLSLMP